MSATNFISQKVNAQPPDVVTTKTRRAPRTYKALKGAGGIATILVLGQILPLSIFAGQGFPTTTEIIWSISQLLISGTTWFAVGQTLLGWFIGFSIASIIAIFSGMAIGSFTSVQTAFNLPVEFLRVIPPIILIPVVVLIQGPTLSMKITLTIIGAIWPVLHQTIYGLRTIDQTIKDTTRIYRFSSLKKIFGVIVPASLPYIVTGLRIGATIGIMVVIVAEMVGGAPGLGQELYLAQTNGQYADMMSFLILAGVLGMCINSGLRFIEKTSLGWHPSQRSN